jgi:hypothetical protein
MMRATRILLTLGLLVIGAACGPANTTVGSPRTRTNVITLEEIERRGQYSNLYELVQELRPRWLRAQGPDTFMGEQGAVQVRMDGNPLGSVEQLRRISPSGVTSLEWVSPIDASARFGMGNSHGAIVISTAPIH